MTKIQKRAFYQILFQVKSKLCSLIRTTGAYWDIITHVKHPTVKGKEKAVKETLSGPDEIRVSKKAKNILLFYKKYNGKFLCVVVKSQKKKGFIITAYFTRKIKEGLVRWKK